MRKLPKKHTKKTGKNCDNQLDYIKYSIQYSQINKETGGGISKEKLNFQESVGGEYLVRIN